MNDQRLRLDLADLADEVTPVDLRDRALRTSRRIGIQRAVATSAAAVVMLAAATGTAFAILPNRGTDPLPATTPSVTASPSPSASPTPSATGSPSAPVSGDPAGSAGTAAFGRVLYGAHPGTLGEDDKAAGHLYSWQPGDGPKRLLAIDPLVAVLNAAVSPNGRRVAWVEDDALWVSAADGSGKRKLRTGVDGQCWGPTWSPDSQRLTIGTISSDPGAYRTGTIEVSSGRFTEVGPADGCHPVWSGDGRTIAYADGSDGRVILASPTGKGKRAIPGLGGDARYSCFDVASLSPDGDRIALYRRGPDMESGDVARELDANVVLDTRTGKAVSLPLGGRELRQVFFQSDGSTVVRVRSGERYTLILVDENGKKVTEQAEPSSLKGMQVIGVAD
ncbi:TolB family protein [Micromonospora echinaurantiaca]|uniref:TolB family protein n=1 Tax=Micromonospora echinaurantiaca TaxID=47857 RepID=UPI003445F75B